MKRTLLLIPAFLAVSALAQPPSFDILVRHTRVIDGTGNPWFRADVGIRDGRIAAIGSLQSATARQVIDARQRILAPGFIDVHVHADFRPDITLTRHPAADSFLFDGVTTIVNGNCGWSFTDLAGFFKQVEQARPGVNVASMIGHGSIRQSILGDDNRAPTQAEFARMKSLVEQGMRDGAVGFSTGLWYVPGNYARTEEVIEMARAAAPFGGVYTTHMRDEGSEILAAVREAIRVAEESGMRLEVSHLKIGDRRNWGDAPKVLALLEEARSRGVDAAADFYPYTAGSTTLQPLFPRWALAGGDNGIRERLTSKETRDRIAREMESTPSLRGGQPDYAYAVVASSPGDPSLVGKSLAQIHRERGGKPGLQNEIQTVIDLRIKGDLILVYHSNGPGDLVTYMRWPYAAVASDTIYTGFGEGAPHPRNYGTNARVLAEFVRKQRVLTLEDAIRRMTSLPARTYDLRDRGLVREGMAADLVLFDPARVQDKATFEKPHQYAEGFDWVLVNGTPVIAEGKRLDARPGQIIRRRAWAAAASLPAGHPARPPGR